MAAEHQGSTECKGAVVGLSSLAPTVIMCQLRVAASCLHDVHVTALGKPNPNPEVGPKVRRLVQTTSLALFLLHPIQCHNVNTVIYDKELSLLLLLCTPKLFKALIQFKHELPLFTTSRQQSQLTSTVHME